MEVANPNKVFAGILVSIHALDKATLFGVFLTEEELLRVWSEYKLKAATEEEHCAVILDCIEIYECEIGGNLCPLHSCSFVGRYE
jgi:hypothetical protein